MSKTEENMWRLERAALEQDFFSLECAAGKLGLTARRAFDLIRIAKQYRILAEYNLPMKRGRPAKLYRLSLKDLNVDKSSEIMEYAEKIRNKADYIALFGSLAAGFADEYSDVDLFVLSSRAVKKPENIEVINVDDIAKIPGTTRFNIVNRGIRIFGRRELPHFELDFGEAVKSKEMKIEADFEILKVAGFPESAGILGMILLNIGYLLLLKQGIVPSCWKEVKLYLDGFFDKAALLYLYYLKFEKERDVSDKQLSLNKRDCRQLEQEVTRIWTRIKQSKFSIPPYTRRAM